MYLYTECMHLWILYVHVHYLFTTLFLQFLHLTYCTAIICFWNKSLVHFKQYAEKLSNPDPKESFNNRISRRVGSTTIFRRQNILYQLCK